MSLNKMSSLMAALIICATGSLHAQERSAAGSIDTQMTWSALKSLVDDANSKTTAAHTRIDGIASRLNSLETCSKKSMFFDGKTCVDPLAGIKNCAANGQIYNGSKCINVEATGKGCNVVAENFATGLLAGQTLSSYARTTLNKQYGLPKKLKDGEFAYYYEPKSYSGSTGGSGEKENPANTTFIQCLNGSIKLTNTLNK